MIGPNFKPREMVGRIMFALSESAGRVVPLPTTGFKLVGKDGCVFYDKKDGTDFYARLEVDEMMVTIFMTPQFLAPLITKETDSFVTIRVRGLEQVIIGARVMWEDDPVISIRLYNEISVITLCRKIIEAAYSHRESVQADINDVATTDEEV